MSPGIWGEPDRLLPAARHVLFSYAGCETILQMRERLRALIAAQPGEVRLIGWSLGGMLALEAVLEQVEAKAGEGAEAAGRMRLTERRPGRIAQAILIGSTLRFVATDRHRGWPARVIRQMRAQLAADPSATLRRFAGSMLSEDDRGRCQDGGELSVRLLEPTDFTTQGLDAGLGYLLESDLGERWASFEAQAFGENRIPGSGAELPDVRWVHGTGDPVCPPGALADVASERIVWLTDAGHAPFLTRSAECQRALRSVADGNR